MDQRILAGLFYRELEKLIEEEALNHPEKIASQYRLLNLIFQELTKKERLQFATLFARIAYVGHQFNLNKRLQYYIHSFRKAAASQSIKEEKQGAVTYELGNKMLAETISALLGAEVPERLLQHLPEQWPTPFAPRPISGYQAEIRVIALDDDSESNQLLVRDEINPSETRRVQYNIPDRNEHFNPSIHAIRRIFGFPPYLAIAGSRN